MFNLRSGYFPPFFYHSDICLLLKLLERCKNIDVKDYDRMREDTKQMQVIYVFMLVSFV